MKTYHTESSVVVARYFVQCKKALNQSIGSDIFLGLLLGELFGTLAFGLYGTIFYFVLMLIGIAVKRTAAKRMKQNQCHPQLLFDSSVILFIMALELNSIGFALFYMFNVKSLSLSFDSYFATAFGIYIIFNLILLAIVFFCAKVKFDPQKYQLDIFEKGTFAKAGAIGAGTGAALGILLARMFRSSPVALIVVGIIMVLLDIVFFLFIAYYLLMYRTLKKEAARAQEQ